MSALAGEITLHKSKTGQSCETSGHQMLSPDEESSAVDCLEISVWFQLLIDRVPSCMASWNCDRKTLGSSCSAISNDLKVTSLNLSWRRWPGKTGNIYHADGPPLLATDFLHGRSFVIVGLFDKYCSFTVAPALPLFHSLLGFYMIILYAHKYSSSIALNHPLHCLSVLFYIINYFSRIISFTNRFPS